MVPQAVIDRIRLAEWRGGPIWDEYIHPTAPAGVVTLTDPLNNLEDDYALLMHTLDCWSRESAEMDMFCDELEKVAVWYDTGVGYRIGNYGRAILRVLDRLEAAS